MTNNFVEIIHEDGRLVAVLWYGVVFELRYDNHNTLQWCSIKTILDAKSKTVFDERGQIEPDAVISSYAKLCSTFVSAELAANKIIAGE